MTGDFDPGRELPLPPFVSRPSRDPAADDDPRPLPPWTSNGRDLGGGPPADAERESHAGADPGPWEEEPAAAAEAEPWNEDAPVADPAEWTAAEPATDDEWSTEPAWEPEEAEEASYATWEPDSDAGDDSEAAEALHDAEEDAHAAQVGLDPWAAAAPIEESTDEPLEDAEEETWLLEEHPDGMLLEVTDEEMVVEIGPNDPWSVEPPDAAGQAVEPAATPLDELVETAGRALGDSAEWTSAPLATFPGEARAWKVAATGGDADARTRGDEAAEAAAALDRLAARLREEGWDGLHARGEDALANAIAAFLHGYRAGRADG